jgi:D-inositol-3-phosphate glycosyltransferase
MKLTMQRVAMISYHTCPLATLGGKDTGGMNVYVRELTRHLGRLGVHVDVFTRSQDEHVPHVLHDLGYGNRVVHIPAGPEVPLSKETLASYLPQFVAEILRFTEQKNLQYDLIHSHYWMSGVAAIELKKSWNTPIIHMYHTLGLMKNRIARSETEMEGEYRVSGEKEVLQAADRVVAATQAERAQLQFLYHAANRKIAIIPPGVDTAHFYPIPPDEAKEVVGIPKGDCLILFVGRIEPLKGIEVLLRALAHQRSNNQVSACPQSLAIIGGDPNSRDMNAEMKRLQILCDELGIGDMVVFLGKRSQSSLPYYYSAAEVMVVPSHYESFGMVALEALACGTPVVASQVGGLAFLIEDGVTGYVVPDDDPVALSERLSSIMDQGELRRQMSANGVKHANKYAWEKVAAKMLALYQEVLAMYEGGSHP